MLNLFLLVFGIFMLVCAIGNFDVFLKRPTGGSTWIMIFGRTGARIFIGFIGTMFILMGFFSTTP